MSKRQKQEFAAPDPARMKEMNDRIKEYIKKLKPKRTDGIKIDEVTIHENGTIGGISSDITPRGFDTSIKTTVDPNCVPPELGNNKKRKHEDSMREDHDHPVCYLLTIHSHMDPKEDTYKKKLALMMKYIVKFERFFKEIGLIMFNANIEWKDELNSNEDDPYIIRPNFHLHFGLVFGLDTDKKGMPYDDAIERLEMYVGLKCRPLTYTDKNYPWRELAYVIKEHYRHLPYVRVFYPEYDNLYDKFIEKWEKYPETRRRLRGDDEKIPKLPDEKTHSLWNAIVTARNYFRIHRIRWYCNEKGDFILISKNNIKQGFDVKTLLEMMKEDVDFKHHWSVRYKKYFELLIFQDNFRIYLDKYESKHPIAILPCENLRIE